MGGTLDDAKDIFHDAIIVYYELRTKNKIHTSEVAYILGIAKHMWIRKYNRQRNHISLSHIENQISIPEDYNLDVPDKNLFSLLNQTGKKCMELLRTFYFKKTLLEELVTVLGYPNKHAASVQKYKCLEKMRNFVKEKTLSYDDFKK
ncbi:sigma-70 family RNA polymerase sigma factor [Maribacter sp. 2210JD10-5]|uniref:sigma-70 family RNA polymerase sigma factor n=1 Tax=Maribacter sp. 2210JD10-5 TaxID=3386272 RepID=UPI0039BCBD38